MADENLTPVAPVPASSTEAIVTPSAPVESAPLPESQGTPTQEIKQEVSTEADPTVLGAEPPAEAKPEVEKAPEPTPEVKPESKPEVKDPKIADGAEEKQPEAEKKEEVSQSDEPAPLPSFDPWTFPDGLAVDEARVGEFNKLLGEFESTTKVSHAEVQKLGQQFLDRHVSEINSVAEKIAEAYDKVWKDQTKQWYDDFKKDPEIGGNRQETTVKAAREFIARHGGTQEQQKAIRTLMQKTGLGNHPELIRLFAKANLNLREPTVVPATAPPAAPQTRKQKFYGKK